MTIYKAYDIRGHYPEELNEALAEQIGAAASQLFAGRTVVVGRDMRVSGPALAAAVIRGLTRAGKAVVDIGAVTTPMVTFAVAQFGYDGGIMVTASHNPGKDNGIKLCKHGKAPGSVEPIGYDAGINAIEAAIQKGDLPTAPTPGSVSQRDILREYIEFLLRPAGDIRDLKVVIDAGNGMAGMLMPPLLGKFPIEVVPLYFEPDGSFPNHEANPLKPENLVDLQKKVVETKANLGVAFDGDADRIIFVDEQGEAISADLVTALLAREMLHTNPGSTILYDLRSSWAVREEIAALGGRAVITRVGHSFIKQRMHDEDAILGGELSGHYYFREFFYADSGAFTLLKVLSLLCRERRPMSQLIKPLQRYFGSKEINSDVPEKDAKIAELTHLYSCGRQSTLDGLSVDFEDWWFNARPSNTEDKLRLVVEAKTRERMEAMRDQVLACIRRPVEIRYPMMVRRVLFPTDFSEYSLQALPYALAMAENYGAELHVLHVIPTPEWSLQFETVTPILDASFFEELERSVRERIEHVVPAEARKRIHVTLAVRQGTAFLEIVRYAKEEKVDLITIATHGHTGLAHALFGSVADKVVCKAPCAVLSVRPREHKFEMP